MMCASKVSRSTMAAHSRGSVKVEGRPGSARQFALAVTARRYEIEQIDQ